MRNVLFDFRYALRQLRKSPGFAVVAILTLALGIGATTAIFTLVYDVLLKPLPYAHPGRLVAMQESVAEVKDLYPAVPINVNHFLDWQRHSHSFQAMTIMEQNSVPLGTGGHTLQTSVVRATSGVFSVLDAAPRIGRSFSAQEEQPGHNHVVVLMNGLWKSHFHSDPNVLGKTITLDGYPYTVIGIMPAGFHLPDLQGLGISPMDGQQKQPQALIPLVTTEPGNNFNYFGLARLKSGISVAQATAELDALQHSISAGLSAKHKMTLSAVLIPFQQYLVGKNRTSLWILLGAILALLLVGCINIANLLLARAVGRRHEMAIASAMGASRSDLLRASMREAGVLAVVGGALGVLLAAALVPILQRDLPSVLNFRGNLHLDWAGAGFALLLAVMATLLAGAAPAWMSWRTQPQEALRNDSRSGNESRGGRRFRKGLVVVEVAVSVVLVLLTGLLTASLYQLMHVHRGFAADRVLTAEINLPSKQYPGAKDRLEFYTEALTKLNQLPGVEHAAVTSELPLGGDSWLSEAILPGDPRPTSQMPVEHWRWISPGYFQAIHLPLVAGRFLSDSDIQKKDAIVSELTAKTLWPRENPIGRRFRHGNHKEPFTVVGVVGNARTISLAKPDPMMIYVPYWNENNATAGLVLRAKQDPAAMASAIRKTIWSVDPSVAVPTVRTLGGVVDDSVAAQRFEMDLLLLFAICAWLLAGLGVYGVVTYSVVQRRREIGVRMALGAQRANIYGRVLREGLAPVVIGAAVGIAAAFGCARLIGSLLFHVSPFNPWIAFSAAVSLLLAGVLACLLPAWRAAAVDPMDALRAE